MPTMMIISITAKMLDTRNSRLFPARTSNGGTRRMLDADAIAIAGIAPMITTNRIARSVRPNHASARRAVSQGNASLSPR